jgi:hypothetical protein
LKENIELKNKVMNLSNKLERCYNSKLTFEHMLKTQRNFSDKCGFGFKKKMTKSKRKREKKMKKQEREKLSHFMCYRCHEVRHLVNGCPNKEKLKKMKEEERLKHEVLHMRSSHLYVPNQAISEATSGASTQATS